MTNEINQAINPKISIVIPFYNEEANISALLKRLFDVLQAIPEQWEVICVNDGSKDATLKLLLEERAQRKGMVVIDLARNFGQHAAVMAGFRVSRGQWVITMDADLQNPPEEIPKLLAAFRKGHDLIGTIRLRRKDTLFRKFASRIMNRLITRISGISLQDFGCMLRGYSREVVDGIVANSEYRTFIPALATFFARNPVEIPVHHEERAGGSSKYSFLKLLSLQLDLMLGFSMWPLRILFFAGTVIAMLGLLLGVAILAMRFYFGTGWAAEGVFTLFAVLFFIVGGQFFALGLIGDYIGRIFQVVRGRPSYVLKEIYRDE
ncbi:MAG: glycosyltransferase [Dissulfurimicrobium sp.]|uniref:glycosyltransferase n=1 Tax=Dissulfurimicrobium sp. TaxID=2022436 RepID=UPI00404AD1F8